MEKISIVVPCYNEEAALPLFYEELQKNLNDFSENISFEILLVNDGSKDSSGEICERYAELDSRVKYICKENGGVVSARKAGTNQATSEYITFIDSDDWVGESFFEELYNKGYIDRKRPLTYEINGEKITRNVRYSEYLPIKEVMQHLYRLNEYYEVRFYKGTFYKETEKLDMLPLLRNEVPIRIFPLQKDNNGDKDWVSMGMLATMNWPNDIKVNIRDVFETIPDNVTEEDF
mgnify:CR=1 FL=1